MADGDKTPDDTAIVDSSIIVGFIIGDLKPSSRLRYRKALNRYRCATTPIIKQESITKLSLHYGRESLAVKQFKSFTSGMVELRRTDDVIREIRIINGKCKGLEMPGKFLKDIEIAATAIVYGCPVITDDRDFQRIRSRDKRLRLITERRPMGARYLRKP